MTEARVRLAHVGMHPSRRRSLEAKLGGPGGLLEAILDGAVEVPDHARQAARISADDRVSGLGDARLVLAGSGDYPSELGGLPDAPDALFMRGGVPTGPRVAVVGSRAATRYGIGVATAIGAALVAAGYPIVSGLARGVDAAAHRGGIQATVAVLGTGVDRWYPAAHRGLGEDILDRGGAIVSEYPPGTPPAPWRFPLRNRIISGLAAAVVVIEAAVTGGALITARAALGQGREVLAVPGDIDRPTSEGCNKLIADGAIPVTSVEDAVAALDVLCGRVRAPRAAHPLADLLGPTGVELDDLPAMLDRSLGEVLATVGRWEVEGLARVDAGRVVPELGSQSA